MKKTNGLFKNLLLWLTVLAVCIGGMAPVNALAAGKKKTTPTIKCYTISTGNTETYSTTKLRRSGRKAYGWIYPSDEITVLEVHDSWCKVRYPIKRGTKTGYIKTSAILTKTTGNYKNAPKIMTAYKRASGSYTYGTVYKNDRIRILGTRGSFTQIKYPVRNGYKYAFVLTSNLKNTSSGGNDGKSDQNNSKSNKSNSNSSGTYIITPSHNNYGKTDLSYGLYRSKSAYISCKFDGYSTTSGRHEGIDIKYGLGKRVYALTDGVVTNVRYGSNGRSGLSTIAVYNSRANKTVIYLHTAPVTLKVGQQIKRGQVIGSEGWRGVSSKSASHTHVEVRSGRRTAAAKSVGDPRLDNENPTSFWNSQGYRIA